MAASATDKVRKKKSLFQTTLNGGIGSGDASLTLQSASGLPTDTGVTIVINRVDANGVSTPSAMEVVTGVVSGSTVGSLVRAEDGTTAKSHANASVVEMVWDAETWNDFCDAYLTEHNQDGTHKAAALSTPINAASSKATPVDADKVPITDSAASNVLKYVTWANVKATLKTYFDTLYGALASANSWAGIQTFIASGVIWDGWQPYTAVTPTRASADDPTYVLTFAGVDLTSKISVGMRLKFTQNSATVFGIVTAISFSTNTTLTLYGGTDYDVADTSSFAISNFAYSNMKAPTGFPIDPSKWKVRVTDSTQRGGATTASTWTNHGTTNAQISLPIGAWKTSYQVSMLMDRSSAGTDVTCKVTLSTANNTESDTQMTSALRYGSSVGNTADIIESTMIKMKTIVVASKTLYYLNAWNNSGNNQYWDNALGDMILEAECAYL